MCQENSAKPARTFERWALCVRRAGESILAGMLSTARSVSGTTAVLKPSVSNPVALQSIERSQSRPNRLDRVRDSTIVELVSQRFSSQWKLYRSDYEAC